MRTVVEAGAVVTVNERDEVLEPGWIDIHDGAITAVSRTPIDATGADRRIDARGKVVMPGLVNAHTHLFQVLIRGVYEHLPFRDWLRSIYHCGRILTEEDCYVSARLGSVEALRSGVTTLVDHHFLNRGLALPEATLAGMRSIGLRTVLARTIMDLPDLAPPEILETPEQGLRSVEALLANHAHELDDGLLTLMTGANTPGISASGELAQAVTQFATDHNIRTSAHIAESPSVVDAVRQRYSRDGVVRWLDELGALAPTLLAAHAVHLSPDEVGIFASRGVSVSHNPVSNMFLGDGIAPVVDMLSAGVNVALGTDGAASNNSQDMFQVLKMASLLQRAQTRDPHAVPPAQALRMATINGARALGLDALTGSLEPGKRADLIVLDLQAAAHNVAIHNVCSHLVYCAKASDVKSVLVDGELVMDDGTIPTLDEPALLAQAQDAARHLVTRLAA
jgi:5-methylthioadenosine/S-adenosylhomocysteine deaminase